MWTAAHGQILTMDNLMLRDHPLANRCYLCCCNAESVDHLLLFCPIAHSLWMYMLRLFGIDQVMPGSVEDLLFCWFHWLGKHSSDIWDLVPGCLMWTIWSDQNRWAFEDELWFSYQSFARGPSLIGLDVGVSRIVLPLRILFLLLEQIRGCFILLFLFSIVHCRELFVFLLLFFLLIIFSSYLNKNKKIKK